MRARNEREREVVTRSHRLKGLTSTQFQWAKMNVADHRILYTKHRAYCTCCGAEFGVVDGSGETMTCPHCGRQSKAVATKKLKYHTIDYFITLTVSGRWQVVRYWELDVKAKVGEQPKYHVSEPLQKWCQPGQPMVTLGVSKHIYPWRCWSPYSIWGDLQVRNVSRSLSVYGNMDYYDEWMRTKLYPRMCLQPVYKKVFSPEVLNRFDCEDFFGYVMANPYFEGLFKAGRYDTLKMLMDKMGSDFSKYWPSVKVALRNGFVKVDEGSVFERWQMFFENLKSCRVLGLDVRSPHYICNKDFNRMHGELSVRAGRRLKMMQDAKERKRLVRAEEQRQRDLEIRKEQEKSYPTRMAPFIGIVFGDEQIRIEALKSVEEFFQEGEAMHHCVFSNGYYKRPNSLIMSARDAVTGERLETIEVNLDTYQIVQSRAKFNGTSDKHERILALVNEAMPRIRTIRRKQIRMGLVISDKKPAARRRRVVAAGRAVAAA